jgi:hypothetical protein
MNTRHSISYLAGMCTGVVMSALGAFLISTVVAQQDEPPSIIYPVGGIVTSPFEDHPWLEVGDNAPILLDQLGRVICAP